MGNKNVEHYGKTMDVKTSLSKIYQITASDYHIYHKIEL